MKKSKTDGEEEKERERVITGKKVKGRRSRKYRKSDKQRETERKMTLSREKYRKGGEKTEKEK